MKTRERAEALAEAAAKFPELSPPSTRDLLETVRLELGHEEILDDFQPYGEHLCMAIAPHTILHVVSGNTPHAALQTMLRGLLVGSHNLVKFPSCGLGALEAFGTYLPRELASQLECSRELKTDWRERADAWIVFGNDETIETLRAQCPPGAYFQSHGHRISFGVVFEDPDFRSCTAAARDVSLFEQQGCLSPHLFYVAQNARGYASRLASEMHGFCLQSPPPTPSPETQAAIAEVRADYEFRSASDPGIQVWKSINSTDWTVIYEENPAFILSPLRRVIFVKPLPEDLSLSLVRVVPYLGAIGLWPATLANARRLSGLGASRLCAIGKMQEPAFTWHADSLQNLASIVRWVDFEQ